ncbi:MAG: urease accessory protein UreD [Nitrosopumilus sp. B06]|nr:MAG: urease accessory protein UreD [Nitrosopumilus sp. D6]RNJ79900.1 MAG: urease accessory protein UreD [Nitrosopumilus sp. B06]
MNRQEFYAPLHVPPQISAFDSETRQLGVGKSGKNGLLQIKLRRDSEETVLADAYSEIPLHIQRVLRCGDSLAYLYMVSASGGILQGDRYRIDINMEEDSRAHVTTQGATRIYSMDSNCATQVVNVRLEKGAYLELVPDQIIPYRDSRFYQETSLDVHSESTMVYSEMLAPGRVGMGESFQYDACCLKMTARDQHGTYRMTDSACIEPKKRKMQGFGVMGEYDIVGTVYILTPARYVSELCEKVNLILADRGIFGGATITRNDAGVLVRILGDRTEKIRDAVLGVAGAVRESVIGVPFSEIRKS